MRSADSSSTPSPVHSLNQTLRAANAVVRVVSEGPCFALWAVKPQLSIVIGQKQRRLYLFPWSSRGTPAGFNNEVFAVKGRVAAARREAATPPQPARARSSPERCPPVGRAPVAALDRKSVV